MGQKSTHIRFDSDGNELKAKESRMLNRVKNFLTRAKGEDNSETTVQFSSNIQVPQVIKEKVKDIPDDEDTEADETGTREKGTGKIQEHEQNKDNLKTGSLTANVQTVNSDRHNSALEMTDNETTRPANESEVVYEDVETREPVIYDLDIWAETGENDNITETKGESKNKRKKKGKKRKGAVAMPPEIAKDLELRKYWGQRYRLFSRFDEGVKLDRGICNFIMLH